MTKHILSFIGIIGLTAASWGQSAGGITFSTHINPSSGPRTNLFFAGFPEHTTGANGSWAYSQSLTDERNNAGFTGGRVYTNSLGHRLTAGAAWSAFDLITNNTWSGPDPGYSVRVAFLANQLYAWPSSGGLFTYTNNLAVGWDDGSQGAGNAYTNGMFLPPEEEMSTGDVFVEQARELNQSLTFRDGQWWVE
jgi:hypothetical protein